MKNSSVINRNTLTALAFVGPFILLYVIFKVYPVFYGVWISVSNFNQLMPPVNLRFVGFRHYVAVFQDPTAMGSIVRSLQYSAMVVGGMVMSALGIAALLNRRFFLRTAGRTMIFMPYITNIIAIGMVWSALLNPAFGPVNSFLASLGVPREMLPRWLLSTDMALPTVAVIRVWKGLAMPVLVLLAAMQDVSPDLMDAARIDGAGPWRRYVTVTLPAISPALFFVIVVTLIDSFKAYDIMKALTNGGPGTATRVMAVEIYEQAFTFYRFATASAEAIILFGIILLITLVQWWGQKRWVHY